MPPATTVRQTRAVAPHGPAGDSYLNRAIGPCSTPSRSVRLYRIVENTGDTFENDRLTLEEALT